MTASWSSADVTAEQWVGGLVGYNNGTVAASYAAGAVSGPGGSVGGLVGHAMPAPGQPRAEVRLACPPYTSP